MNPHLEAARRILEALSAVCKHNSDGPCDECQEAIITSFAQRLVEEGRAKSKRGCCFTSTPMACPIHDIRNTEGKAK